MGLREVLAMTGERPMERQEIVELQLKRGELL